MQPKNEKSVYRHRGYICSSCNITTMIFGCDNEPDNCPNCNAPKGSLKQQWDHKVTTTVFVEDIVK